MSVSEDVRNMKSVSPLVASADSAVRNEALRLAALALKEHQDEIFEANREDLLRAEKAGIAPAVMKRLKFDAHKLSDCLAGIDSLMALENPKPTATMEIRKPVKESYPRETVRMTMIGRSVSISSKRPSMAPKSMNRSATRLKSRKRWR